MSLSIDSIDSIEALAERAAACARPDRAALIGISGIDGSGKGTVASLLKRELSARGLRVALIGVDPWHNPRRVRFSDFYAQAFRFEELFEQLVEPLRAQRSITLFATQIELALDRWYPQLYTFEDVDLILLEGIFLFRRELRERFDLAVWIDCSFETALERALRRNQEGESEEVLRRDYDRIYFPAQRVHFEHDSPRERADLLYDNDPGRAVHAPMRNSPSE